MRCANLLYSRILFILLFLVLKSDNANGLFAFSTGQSLSQTVSETVGNVSFKVQRTLGFFGKVTVDWVIFRKNGSRASHDFVQPSGSLLFAKGEKQKVRPVSHVLLLFASELHLEKTNNSSLRRFLILNAPPFASTL